MAEVILKRNDLRLLLRITKITDGKNKKYFMGHKNILYKQDTRV